MATWTAKCWLGSENGYQELQVQSNTINGAKAQLERIYGAEQIENLREVGSGGYSPGMGFGGLAGLAFIGTVGWLAWEAWKFTSAIVISAWQWFMGLFSWIPFMSPQLLVFLVLGFFFFILILGALSD